MQGIADILTFSQKIRQQESKLSREQTEDQYLGKTQSERLEFWNEFNDILTRHGTPFNKRKATTDHWYDVVLGTSQVHIVINLVSKDGEVMIEVQIKNNKELFDKLYDQSNEIEERLGFRSDWDRLDKKKASRIKYHMSGLNFDDHSNYSQLMNDIIDKVIQIKNAFKEYV